MKLDTMLIGPLLVLLAGICLYGCNRQQSSTAKSSFASAKIQLFYPEARTVHITDPDRIGKLMSFFPGVGSEKREKRSGIPRGWETEVRVDFVRADGQLVVIKSNYEYWTEQAGKGDWPVHGDLAKFVDELFAKPE